MAIRLGFIGTGGISNRHLTTALNSPDMEIVGVCDIDMSRATQAAETYGGTPFEKFTDLYDQVKPDAVVICTPPFGHGSIEEGAAERGIPFFVEKPVAVNMAMAARVLKAVRAANLTTQVGYMFRLAEPLIKVRELLSTRAVAMVQAHYYMPGLPGPKWWPHIDLGGGQLIEQTTHMLDLGRFLAGDVVSVSGRTATVRDWKTVPPGYQPEGLLKYSEVFDIPDTTALTMQYESGALGTVSCSIVPQAKWDVGFKVVADGLIITIDGASASWSGDEEGSMQPGDDWASYVLREFTDAVVSGGKTSVPYEEGVKSLAISIAGYESVKQGGCPVDLVGILPEKL
jgi:predicted dehydrogenase